MTWHESGIQTCCVSVLWLSQSNYVTKLKENDCLTVKMFLPFTTD